MPYKFNPFTSNLDYYQPSTTPGSGVTGISPTIVTHITRWADTAGTTIEDSDALVQDGGAIEAQGFITRRTIDDLVVIPSGESWIAPSLELELSGSIELEPNGELIIV